MKRSTIVLGFLAAAVSASMALAQPAATEKSTGTAPASTTPSGTAAPAKAPPANTAPGNAPAATAPAGTTPSTTAPSATSQGAAAAGKEAHRGSAAAGGTAPLLTPDEASAHRAAMQSFKNVDECNAYFVKHQKLINDRAKEKGVAVPADRGSPCARMAARGFHP